MFFPVHVPRVPTPTPTSTRVGSICRPGVCASTIVLGQWTTGCTVCPETARPGRRERGVSGLWVDYDVGPPPTRDTLHPRDRSPSPSVSYSYRTAHDRGVLEGRSSCHPGSPEPCLRETGRVPDREGRPRSDRPLGPENKHSPSAEQSGPILLRSFEGTTEYGRPAHTRRRQIESGHGPFCSWYQSVTGLGSA